MSRGLIHGGNPVEPSSFQMNIRRAPGINPELRGRAGRPPTLPCPPHSQHSCQRRRLTQRLTPKQGRKLARSQIDCGERAVCRSSNAKCTSPRSRCVHRPEAFHPRESSVSVSPRRRSWRRTTPLRRRTANNPRRSRVPLWLLRSPNRSWPRTAALDL